MHEILIVSAHTFLLPSHGRHADAQYNVSLISDQASKQLSALQASSELRYHHLASVSNLSLNIQVSIGKFITLDSTKRS